MFGMTKIEAKHEYRQEIKTQYKIVSGICSKREWRHRD